MLKTKKLFLVLIIFLTVILLIFAIPKIERRYFYPLEYMDDVNKYSQEYEIDKYFILSVIKTESSFNEKATSSVGARGLMQIMPNTFDWIKSKNIAENNIDYDDMYVANYNIQFGSFLLSYLYNKFESYELAAAAYHAGITQVVNWLNDDKVSQDGISIEQFPSSVTNHYVNKVMNSFESYKNIYKNE